MIRQTMESFYRTKVPLGSKFVNFVSPILSSVVVVLAAHFGFDFTLKQQTCLIIAVWIFYFDGRETGWSLGFLAGQQTKFDGVTVSPKSETK